MNDNTANERSLVDEACAQWLVAHDRGLTADEERRFAMWLRDSAEHGLAWDAAAKLWAEFDLAPDPLLASMRSSALSMRGPRIWTVLPTQMMAAAAALALCVGIGAWSYHEAGHGLTGPDGNGRAVARSYVATVGTMQVALSDGSHVQLDARSRIDVLLTAHSRNIALRQGRAFFSVAHDVTRPFVVTAQGHSVTATGTAFGVSVFGQRLSVVLAQGKVTVASADASEISAKLVAGQEYSWTNSGAGSVRAVDVDKALSWRDGFLELSDVTVRDAVDQMNRYSARVVSVGDAKAAALRVSGRFRTDDPIRFATRLSEIYPIRVVMKGDGGAEIRSK